MNAQAKQFPPNKNPLRVLWLPISLVIADCAISQVAGHIHSWPAVVLAMVAGGSGGVAVSLAYFRGAKDQRGAP